MVNSPAGINTIPSGTLDLCSHPMAKIANIKIQMSNFGFWNL
jgi:hypothetical protein